MCDTNVTLARVTLAIVTLACHTQNSTAEVHNRLLYLIPWNSFVCETKVTLAIVMPLCHAQNQCAIMHNLILFYKILNTFHLHYPSMSWLLPVLLHFIHDGLFPSTHVEVLNLQYIEQAAANHQSNSKNRWFKITN